MSTLSCVFSRGSLRELARYLSSSSLTHVRSFVSPAINWAVSAATDRHEQKQKDGSRAGGERTDSLQGEQEDTKVQHKDSWHEAIFCLPFVAIFSTFYIMDTCCSKTKTETPFSVFSTKPAAHGSQGLDFTLKSATVASDSHNLGTCLGSCFRCSSFITISYSRSGSTWPSSIGKVSSLRSE